MKYYLSGPRYASFDKRKIAERLISTEKSAVDTAFRTFFATTLKQIDICGRRDDGTNTLLMKLHRRRGKTNPAVWSNDDELVEPTV